MILSHGPGVVGNDGVAWGTDAAGNVVLAISTSRAVITMAFTPGEARDFGCAAIHVAMMAAARVGEAPAESLGEASPLVGADGMPIARRH